MNNQNNTSSRKAMIEKNCPQWKTIYESPARLLIIITATIFMTHTLAMEMFSVFFPQCPLLIEVFVESALLSVMLFPILYYYSFRPLMVHIKERNQAEEVMRQSEDKYRHLFDNLSDAVFLTVVETGRILDTNKQGESLLGRTREEILGMSNINLFPLDQVETNRRCFARYALSDTVVRYDSIVIRKNSTIVPVHISGVPMVLYGIRVVIELFRELPQLSEP